MKSPPPPQQVPHAPPQPHPFINLKYELMRGKSLTQWSLGKSPQSSPPPPTPTGPSHLNVLSRFVS